MKRLTEEEEERLTALAKRKLMRRLAERVKRAARRAKRRTEEVQRARFARNHNVVLHHLGRDREPLMVPACLSLRENRKEVVELISALRQIVLMNNRQAFLFFDKVERLEAAATLLLVAELYRCRHLKSYRKGRSVTGNYPKTVEIYHQLREMGFFKILEVAEQSEFPAGTVSIARPVFLPFHTLNSVDSKLAADFGEAVTRDAFQMAELTKNRMVAALKEAMGNAHEHAYSQPSSFPIMKNRWWMAGHLDLTEREMMIIILDQGIGIPNTLDPDLLERILAVRNFTVTPTDAMMIEAATELHRTSTGEAGRGRGFRDMKRFIDTCDDGELRVLSNRGEYTYMRQNETRQDFSDSIGGTLLEWRVRHGSVAEIPNE